MPEELRWSQRRAVVQSLDDDLRAMEQTVNRRRSGRAIERALEELSGTSDLVGWAAVAVRQGADGSTTTYVCGDPDSSDLEVKGYLHSAVWQAAHQEEGLAL